MDYFTSLLWLLLWLRDSCIPCSNSLCTAVVRCTTCPDHQCLSDSDVVLSSDGDEVAKDKDNWRQTCWQDRGFYGVVMMVAIVQVICFACICSRCIQGG